MENTLSCEKTHNEKLVEEIKALTSECSTLLEQKRELQNEVLTASEYVVNLEDKCWQANKTSLDLLATVKELETEVDQLKGFIIDLKSRTVFYVPDKNDIVDIKLAEFINSYPDRQKLRVMFQRDLPGHYTFGTRKVAIRFEREKLMCKAGGAYLLIEKFLEIYMALETEKMVKKSSQYKGVPATVSRREGRTSSATVKTEKSSGSTSATQAVQESKSKCEVSPARHQFVPKATRSGNKRATHHRERSKRNSDTRAMVNSTSVGKMNTARRSMLELLEE